MSLLRIITLLSAIVLALGYTVPGNFNEDIAYLPLFVGDQILIRNPRSPKDLKVDVDYNDEPSGTSANVDYKHSVNKDFAIYADASRDFTYSDNGGYAGLQYSFGN